MRTISPSEQDLPRPARQAISWNVAVFCLIFSGLIVVTSRTIADPDLWGHVRFGLDTLQNHGVMYIDPYSYLTTGQPWINHEWLAEVIFALAWRIGKATGLVAIKTGIWILTYFLLYLVLNRQLKSPLRVGILLFLSMTITFPFFITVRPHAFTALLYVLTLVLILQAESGNYAALWGCIPIFAVWPNLHGAFLAGAGIMCLWAIIHLLQHRSVSIWKKVLVPLFLSGLATLVNPYGINLLTFLFLHINDPRLEIIEWQPMQIYSLTGFFYLLWLTLIVIGLFYSRKPRNPTMLILLVITANLPFLSLRYVMFFILTGVVIAGEHLGDAWERIMPRPNSTYRRSSWAPILALITAILLLAWKWTNFKAIPIKNPENYPIASISLLRQSEVSGNLAVHFDWGDYAIWHLTPKLKVSIDTRREMAYSESIYKMNVRFMTGIGNWSFLLDAYPTNLALVKTYTPTDNLMKQRIDWVEIYRDEVSVLYSSLEYDQREKLAKSVQIYQMDSEDMYFP